MEPLDTAAIAARIVAWHNRHPLARRITPEQVQGVGVVALPFAPTGRKGALLPALGEAFLPRWLQWRAARFAARQADAERPGPADWPQRDINPDTKRLGPEGSTQWRYLATAAIEVGDRRLRVLMAPSADGAVLGQHLWHGPKLAGGAGALALAVALLGGLALVLKRPSLPAPVLAAATVASAPAAPASLVAAAPASAAAAPPAAAAASAPVPEVAASATSIAAVAKAPASSASEADIRPRIDADAIRAGRLELAEARARQAAKALLAMGDGHTYALVSPPRRTRAEAEQMVTLLRDRALEADPGTAARIETLAAGTPSAAQWQAVWWPFVSEEAALAAQARLRDQGVKLEVMSF